MYFLGVKTQDKTLSRGYVYIFVKVRKTFGVKHLVVIIEFKECIVNECPHRDRKTRLYVCVCVTFGCIRSVCTFVAVFGVCVYLSTCVRNVCVPL